MATKTISIDLEAYERLSQARRTPRESFSRVIKRAIWPAPPGTGLALLEALKAVEPLNEETLLRLEAAQAEDRQQPAPEVTEIRIPREGDGPPLPHALRP
jgi:hypothetical protein